MLLASDAFMQANYAQSIELWQKVMDLNSPGGKPDTVG